MRMMGSIARPQRPGERYWVVPHVAGAQVIFVDTREEAQRLRESIIAENIREYRMPGQQPYVALSSDDAVEHYVDLTRLGRLDVLSVLEVRRAGRWSSVA